MLARALPIALALVALLAGCDTFGQAPSAARGPMGEPTPTLRGEQAPGQGAATNAEALNRQPVVGARPGVTPTPRRRGQRKVPPAGVEAELGLFGSGGGSLGGGCLADPLPAEPTSIEFFASSPWAMSGSGNNIEAGARASLCFNGVVPTTPVDVVVTRPDGRQDTFQVVPKAPYGLAWVVMPGEPYGLYHVEITQGERFANNMFAVVPATRPHIVADPAEAKPGAPITLIFAGFAPNSDVRAHVYQAGACQITRPVGGISCGSYVSSLPPVRTDGQGQAVYVLTISPDDLPDSFPVFAIVHDALPAEEQTTLGTFALH